MIRYPDSFKLADSSRVKVVCSFYRGHIGKEDGELVEIPFGEHETCYIAVRSLVPYSPPVRRSRTSLALYYAWATAEAKGWLLQYLPANAETSCHSHMAKQEILYLLAGKLHCFTDTANGSMVLEPGQKLIIPPKTVHQLATGVHPAVALLEIEDLNGTNPLSQEDYVYHPKFTAPA